MKIISQNILANLITFSRVGLIPWLIAGELQGNYFQSLMIMFMICFTDIIDGKVARKGGGSNKIGKILDVTADFIVVISIFLFWYIQKKISLYILFLLFSSFASFVVLSFLKKEIVKNRMGQYTGAVCFAGIILVLISRTYFSVWVIEIKYAVYIMLSVFLILSTIENILLIVNLVSSFRTGRSIGE